MSFLFYLLDFEEGNIELQCRKGELVLKKQFDRVYILQRKLTEPYDYRTMKKKEEMLIQILFFSFDFEEGDVE